MTDVGTEDGVSIEPNERTQEGAVRTDADTGALEEALFFGGPDRLFGVTHRPAKPTVGVVICSPIHAELLRTYRREVLLARSLAAAGYAVQRFHYRGTGNSDGRLADITFESMVEDVDDAAVRLLAATGVERLAFVGIRLGAAVAAVSARSHGAVALVVWEPVLNAKRYFDEIFRGHLVSGLKSTDGAKRKPLQELRDRGTVDVLGYSIDRPLYDSVRARRLLDDVSQAPPNVLLVRIGGSKNLGGDQDSLVGRWREAGATVEVRQISRGEPWWFGLNPRDVEEEPDRMTGLVEVTSEWMQKRVPPRA